MNPSAAANPALCSPSCVFPPPRGENAATIAANAAEARWFKQEIEPHEAELRAFLRSRFHSLIDLDDLVQEAYYRVFRAHHGAAVTNAKSFLFTTARNIALDIVRHNQVLTIEALGKEADLSVLEDRPDAAEAASHAQELDLLARAIQTLPPRCREILRLRRFHGMSYREIAQTLGIAERTVNAQLAIGIARCREYFFSRGVCRDEPGAPNAVKQSK